LSLGELLAALAIIGALSALLLPAFARARANARAAVCLGNLRTIAQAVRMYVSDNDGSLPPIECDPDVLAYFDTRPGGRGLDMWDPADCPHCLRARQSNPYLRWPVILDEYLLTRDVWRCMHSGERSSIITALQAYAGYPWECVTRVKSKWGMEGTYDTPREIEYGPIYSVWKPKP
jgi:hypothetical protein